MITLIQLPIARLFVALSLLAALTMTAAAQESYEKTLQGWRADREAKLKADDGWLTVSGLFWLREGVNEFGAAPTFITYVRTTDGVELNASGVRAAESGHWLGRDSG